MPLERHHLFALSRDGLCEFAGKLGMPAYRADQVLEWVYGRQVDDPAGMTNLSKADRGRLGERLRIAAGRVVRRQSATDGVEKLLVDWSDQPARLAVIDADGAGEAGSGQSECVKIPAGGRRTACISSQVGCPAGCTFCASGLGGLEANLSAGQMVEQVWQLGRLGGVGRISNVVFMGMGEPLANFDHVVAAVRTLAADWAMGISPRRITISTVGLPSQIRRLADGGLGVTLAISLHAPDDELRRTLIPWAKKVSIDELIDAGRYYFDRTGREVTIEYVLLRQVNDRPVHARQLAQIARRLRSNVNLIRYNEVKGLPFDRPRSDDVHAFQKVLQDAGVNVHIRASRGRDIAAACGQLRHEARSAANT